MNIAQIHERRLSEQFRPFAVIDFNGKRYKVPRRECIAVSKSTVAGLGKNDSVKILDAFEITAIEDLPVRKTKRR
jgi:ribosomal protein L21